MRIVKNLGDRYKILDGHQTVWKIEEALKGTSCPLTREQRVKLVKAFGDSGNLGNLDMPFIAYSWDEEKKTGKNPIYRMSIPLLILWTIIVAFFIQPVKWIFTGKYNFSQKSWVSRTGVSWYNKIFEHRWGEDR